MTDPTPEQIRRLFSEETDGVELPSPEEAPSPVSEGVKITELGVDEGDSGQNARPTTDRGVEALLVEILKALEDMPRRFVDEFAARFGN